MSGWGNTAGEVGVIKPADVLQKLDLYKGKSRLLILSLTSHLQSSCTIVMLNGSIMSITETLSYLHTFVLLVLR